MIAATADKTPFGAPDENIPLHSRFGLTAHDVDLRQVTATHLYPAIRQAFETHSALLFSAQQITDADGLAQICVV